MTIQQHASFDSSTAELNATGKLVKAWESKNAKNAAKAGGISLMALSLAACGGSSTTTTTPVVDTPVVDTPAVDAAKSFVLTTATNSGATFTGGSGNDTFDATHLTMNAGDRLDGGAGTDTLNIVNQSIGAYSTPTGVVTGIENITVRNLSGSEAVAAVTGVTAQAQVVTVTAVAPSAATNDVTVTYGGLTTVIGTSGGTDSAHADILAAAINGLAGATVATVPTSGSLDHIITITAPVAGTALPFIGFSSFTNTADAPTIAYTTPNKVAVTAVTGVAATTASTMTVDATAYTGATTFTTDTSAGLTNFTGLTNAQSANMVGGSGGMGAGYAATATSATLGISSGTTAGNITLTGALVTSADITSTVAKNTVGTIDLAGASTVTLDAATNLTATAINTTATAGSLTISGAGAVSMGVLDDGFTTVSAAGNSGGITLTGPANSPNASITLSEGNDVFTTDDDGFTAAQTFAVNAGGGTGDILVVAAAADIDTASESARYTNFETVRIGDSYDGDQIAGIKAIQLSGATSKTYSDLTADQAGNVQVRGDETSAVFVLKTATGTADHLSVTMGTGLTTSAATNLTTGVTVTGFEKMTITENGGATATAGANRTATVDAFTTATTLADIDLGGRAVTLGNIATTVAVDIDGTALTGNGSASGLQGLSVAGSAVAGSVINGSEVNDSMTVGAEGSTYKGNGGADAFSATAALILADGATDLVLDGGLGTDTLTLTNTTGNTLTDAHFTNISGMEALTLTNTGAGDTTISTGAAFNASFADGVTITSGVIAATKDISVAAGLSTVDMTVTIAATSQTGATTETNSIVTGSGADTITYTDIGWVGAASGNASGTFAIDTNAGDDTISLTVGTLVNDTTANFITITGGSGQDSMTKVGTNDNSGVGIVTFEFAAGDSNTVNYDTITGFDLATGTLGSDELDFEGTAKTGSFTAQNDFGIIATHSLSAGIITFDDAASYAAALTINSGNLADVVGYLALNMTANHVVSFEYDSTNNGTADGTMVFHQGSAASVADDLVFLAGVTGADAIIETNTPNANDLFIA